MRITSLLLIILLLFSCESSNNKSPGEHNDDYFLACEDVITITDDEIRDSLTMINDENKKIIRMNGYVLVCSYVDKNYNYDNGDTVITDWGDTWVTVVPEIRNFFKDKDFENDSLLNFRAAQLLGLPPDFYGKEFLEIWVKPDDLFRPSPDNEITDSVALRKFPAGASPEYITWFNKKIKELYYPDEGDRYPWTRLGYTYDWNNETDEFGLSEFVIRQNSKVIINDIVSTKYYLDF